jgi:hypothetical protein
VNLLLIAIGVVTVEPLPAPDPPFAGIPGPFAEITDHGALGSRKFT